MATAAEILAQQIEGLRRQVAGMRAPSLPNSSIDDGALTVTQNDGNGNQQPTAYVGVQYDGTSGAVIVAGPTPPIPSAPTLTSFIGGVKVRWDGTFVDPQSGFTSPVVAPLDFSRVDVHVSDDPGFPEVGFGTNHGSIVSASSGEVFVPWPVSGTQLYARLVTRTKPGKSSAPGPAAGPVPSGQVQLGDLGFNIAQYAGGNTIYFTVSPATPTAPSWGFTPGDLWLQQTGTSTGANGNPPAGTPLYLTYRWLGSQWVLLQDQGISNSLASAITAQQLANGKTTTFTQATSPTYSGAANTAMWVDTAHGNRAMIWNGSSWIAYQLGNGAIQPNSLIASNVIATGTVTAALLETNMVLANIITAGNPKGDHATMQSDGFHVFQVATGAQGSTEIARLGTGSNDFFGIVDSSGTIVGSWDSTGYVSASGGNFTGEITVEGRALTALLAGIPGSDMSAGGTGGAQNWYGIAGGSGIGNVTAEVGLFEIPVYVTVGRTYKVTPVVTWDRVGSGAELHLQVRDGGTATPTLSSTSIYYQQFSGVYNDSYDVPGSAPGLWTPSTGGLHRLLVTVANGGASGVVNVKAGDPPRPDPTLIVEDLGPSKPYTNVIVNRGGGTSAPAPQQYDTGWLAPSSQATYGNNATLRTDTTDIVQGWDPSGYNADGYGFVGFSLPNITGNVDSVQLSLPWNFTYFNSGGTALITPLHSGAASPYSSFQGLVMKPQWAVGLSGKSGSVNLTLPSDWFPLFSSNSNPRASFIGFGAAGTTNEQFYVRFTGPNIRLRVLYTQ